MLSKILPQIIISTITSVITSVLFIIALNAPVKFWAFIILTPIVANVFFAIFGLIMNIAFPKFDFENEVQVIKQSLATLIVLFSQMLLGVAATVGSFILAINSLYLLAAILPLLFFVLLTVVGAILLFGPCARRYAKFEA